LSSINKYKIGLQNRSHAVIPSKLRTTVSQSLALDTHHTIQPNNNLSYNFHQYEPLNPQDPDVNQEKAENRVLCNGLADLAEGLQEYNQAMTEL